MDEGVKARLALQDYDNRHCSYRRSLAALGSGANAGGHAHYRKTRPSAGVIGVVSRGAQLRPAHRILGRAPKYKEVSEARHQKPGRLIIDVPEASRDLGRSC
jgi:hypothetical protein